MLSQQQIYLVSELLSSEDISLSDLFCAYIDGSVGSFQLTGNALRLRKDLCRASTLNTIITTLLNTPATSASTACIARNVTTHQYIDKLGKLLLPAAGFQFNASRAASSQFETFSSVKMAKTFEELCPTLWQLFGVLLNGAVMKDTSVIAKRRGDYLTELTYRRGEDAPASTGRTRNPTEEDPIVSEVFDEMPDKDWGGHSDASDSSDDEQLVIPSEAADSNIDESREWRAKSGTRWQKSTGDALERQLERTLVVSQLV